MLLQKSSLPTSLFQRCLLSISYNYSTSNNSRSVRRSSVKNDVCPTVRNRVSSTRTGRHSISPDSWTSIYRTPGYNEACTCWTRSKDLRIKLWDGKGLKTTVK
ncbi:hypothetical protein OSTOST_20036 [Ostertagia ostertagi]